MVSVALSLSRGGDGMKISRREHDAYLEWERFVRDAGVDPLIWFVHFGERLPSQVSCRDCVDFHEGFCMGDYDPVKCMQDAVSEVIPF